MFKLISQLATHHDILPKTSLHIYTLICTRYGEGNNEGKGIAAMPRSILRISIQTVNLSYLNLLCSQRGRLLFFLFIIFSDKLRSPLFCFSASLHRSWISRTKIKAKKTSKGKLAICWLMHDQHRVNKSHAKIQYVLLSGAQPVTRSALAAPGLSKRFFFSYKPYDTRVKYKYVYIYSPGIPYGIT